MRLRWILFLVYLPAVYSFAQPVIRSGAFPMPGDTVFFLTDDIPDEIELEPGGERPFWNFLSLRAPYLDFYRVSSASSGKDYNSFPRADIMLIDRKGKSKYYAIQNNRITLLGGRGIELLGENLTGVWSYTEPLIERMIPTETGQMIESKTTFEIQSPIEDFDRTILNFVPFFPDSIKIESIVSRKIETDTWGVLALPGGQFNVLRQKVTDRNEYRVWIKRIGNSWIEISSMMPSNFPGPAENTYYEFLSEDSQYPLAIIYVDLFSRPQRAIYQAVSGLRPFYRIYDPDQWLYAYPNPAISKVRFKFSKIPAGNYTIRFYNILGKPLFERSYRLGRSKTIEINIAQLDKGTYLYCLLDDQGNKITTKRLIILKP